MKTLPQKEIIARVKNNEPRIDSKTNRYTQVRNRDESILKRSVVACQYGCLGPQKKIHMRILAYVMAALFGRYS